MSLALGVLAIQFPLKELMLSERLNMRPGLPPYNMWVEPNPTVYLRVSIFSVANAERFLSGDDTKLKIIEIGPIVYREHLRHTDIETYENSTLSYTAERHVEFLTHLNEPGILNKTITVPNFAVLVRMKNCVTYIFYMTTILICFICNRLQHLCCTIQCISQR